MEGEGGRSKGGEKVGEGGSREGGEWRREGGSREGGERVGVGRVGRGWE